MENFLDQSIYGRKTHPQCGRYLLVAAQMKGTGRGNIALLPPGEGKSKRKHCLLPACPLLLMAAPGAFLHLWMTSFSSRLTTSGPTALQVFRAKLGMRHPASRTKKLLDSLLSTVRQSLLDQSDYIIQAGLLDLLNVHPFCWLCSSRMLTNTGQVNHGMDLRSNTHEQTTYMADASADPKHFLPEQAQFTVGGRDQYQRLQAARGADGGFLW